MVWKIKIAHKGLLDQSFLKTLWLDRFYFLLTIIWNKIASILQKELHSIEIGSPSEYFCYCYNYCYCIIKVFLDWLLFQFYHFLWLTQEKEEIAKSNLVSSYLYNFVKIFLRWGARQVVQCWYLFSRLSQK